MKKGDRVKTEFGPGTVICREGNEGILKERVFVKVDSLPRESLQFLQEQQGYLVFFEYEIEPLT